jgi:predicted nucleic-acid-binding protein
LTALDTNILARFLVTDDERPARLAKALIERLDADEERGFVSRHRALRTGVGAQPGLPLRSWRDH